MTDERGRQPEVRRDRDAALLRVVGVDVDDRDDRVVAVALGRAFVGHEKVHIALLCYVEAVALRAFIRPVIFF